jgi:integrase
LGRWILPHFLDWQLGEITTPEVQRFINRYAGYSKSVLKHIRATLSVLMKTAVDWQYLEGNPVQGVRLPPGKAVRRANVLAPEQVRLVVENLTEPYRTMVIVTFLSGMRESEALALRWEDFDQTRQVVKVRRSLYRGKVNTPKTEKSEREIPCGVAVRDAIQRHEPSDNGFVFVAPKGGFFSAQRITRTVFKPLAERLGIPQFTWRSLRRSAETAMHNLRTPLKVQQQILGHADPNITLLYAEPNLDERRRAVDQLESLLPCSAISVG